MLFYTIRRLAFMVVLLWAISVIGFIIIELPPGSYLNVYMAQLRARGGSVNKALVASLRKQFDLDSPQYVRYFKWVWKGLHGNLGMSLQKERAVADLIAERLPATIMLSLSTMFFVYMVAVPIGIHSATHQYSGGDYFFTFFGFAGLAIPNFLLALVLMFLFYKYFGVSLTGLFSSQYAAAAWSMGKFMDMLAHLPIPIIVIGTAGTAGLIRVMRGCLLDELKKQYVITARAKGVAERHLLFKYPVRLAINPVISTIGWELPAIFSGAVITSIVLSLPTVGELMYTALRSQDMYLASSCLIILAALTLIGTFISDLLLVWIDPRIHYEKKG